MPASGLVWKYDIVSQEANGNPNLIVYTYVCEPDAPQQGDKPARTFLTFVTLDMDNPNQWDTQVRQAVIAQALLESFEGFVLTQARLKVSTFG